MRCRNGEQSWNIINRSNKLVSLKEDVLLTRVCAYLMQLITAHTRGTGGKVECGTLMEIDHLTFPIFLHENIYIFNANLIRLCIPSFPLPGLVPACHYHLASLSQINVSLREPHSTQSCLQPFQEANN